MHLTEQDRRDRMGRFLKRETCPVYDHHVKTYRNMMDTLRFMLALGLGIIAYQLTLISLSLSDLWRS